jgi:hypothetical protein
MEEKMQQALVLSSLRVAPNETKEQSGGRAFQILRVASLEVYVFLSAAQIGPYQQSCQAAVKILFIATQNVKSRALARSRAPPTHKNVDAYRVTRRTINLISSRENFYDNCRIFEPGWLLRKRKKGEVLFSCQFYHSSLVIWCKMRVFF